MLIFNLISNPLQFVGFLIALLLAITIHEYSHAWAANLYGDATAKLHGRLTLNPLAHLDPLGTIFLFLAGFGWGKPVPVNSNNFRNPKLDNLTVSLAGPMSNFLLALFVGLIFRFINLPPAVSQFIVILIFFNLVLMIFNLIPIPPLDGSKILSLFLNEQTYLYFQQIGITLLFGLIIISSVFYPIIPAVLTRTVTFFFTLITGKPIL
ncbi:MAG TPA: site-2 protease family protein [Patescibacteria group bacterium]|nr:site-2 protease family protein [Patescibacteria group bacterium]